MNDNHGPRSHRGAKRLSDIMSPRPSASSRTRIALLILLPFAAVVALAGCHQKEHWHLSNVTHIVAPLKFSMPSTLGHVETAKDLRGKVVMMYFGYTHCPDVCPTTLASLAGVIRKLGPEAKDVRLLFVTVDPKRDTLPVLTQYVAAFDKDHFIGLRGSPEQIKELAKRYRVGYSLEKPDKHGDYIVNHSSAVFIFDRDGNARLLGTNIDSPSDYEADLKQILNKA